jgi:tetratricopeptide (TPR) repeat protein
MFSKLRLLTFLFLLLCIPLTSSAAESIYTYQLGSFAQIEDAEKQFDSLVNLLSENNTDHLRIEKIGKFYSVRLGKFANKNEAEAFLLPIKNRLTQYLLMKAYYKKERIVKLYQPAIHKQPETKEEAEITRKPVKITPQRSEVEEKNVSEKTKTIPAEDHLKFISSLVNNKKYKEALEFIEPKLAEHPEDSGMNGWYGRILLKLEQPEEAIKYLRKASELSPGVADYHNDIGYCLFDLNRFHDAINEFNKAVTINPSYVDALAGMGATYAKLGQRDNAMDVYNKLKKLNSNTAYKLLQIINKM